jgi:hypothetical protein
MGQESSYVSPSAKLYWAINGSFKSCQTRCLNPLLLLLQLKAIHLQLLNNYKQLEGAHNTLKQERVGNSTATGPCGWLQHIHEALVPSLAI